MENTEYLPCAGLEWDAEDDGILNYNGLCIGEVIQAQRGVQAWYADMLAGSRRIFRDGKNGQSFDDYEAARLALWNRAARWLTNAPPDTPPTVTIPEYNLSTPEGQRAFLERGKT
jgi:hypothetical protein